MSIKISEAAEGEKHCTGFLMGFWTARRIPGWCGTQPSGTHPDMSYGEIVSQSHLDEGWRRGVHLPSPRLLPVSISQISPDRSLPSLHFWLMRPLKALLYTSECSMSFKSRRRTQLPWWGDGYPRWWNPTHLSRVADSASQCLKVLDAIPEETK